MRAELNEKKAAGNQPQNGTAESTTTSHKKAGYVGGEKKQSRSDRERRVKITNADRETKGESTAKQS